MCRNEKDLPIQYLPDIHDVSLGPNPLGDANRNQSIPRYCADHSNLWPDSPITGKSHAIRKTMAQGY